MTAVGKLNDIVQELQVRVSVAKRPSSRRVARRRISQYERRMIASLSISGHKPGKIARSLGISRTTVYYHLHPQKYEQKLEYVRNYEKQQRSPWKLEHSDWELEDG